LVKIRQLFSFFATDKKLTIMRLKKIVRLLTVLLFFPFAMQAQVTTSSITGTVKNNNGEVVVGSTITATHIPSGTVYSTVSKKGGSFNLPNVRIGGPYKIEISNVGYTPVVKDGINLQLGEPYNLDIVITNSNTTLSNITVIGNKRRTGADKIGASTNISNLVLTTLPTISRSITDFTRTTPQANGTSFGGRDGRYNNIQVDGVNLNNNFGLSTDALPGGGNPISLDAIEEISVNIAPFDVRQSGFTGAGISAVTKSGTNTFKGSAYGLYRDQSFNGLKVIDQKLSVPTAQKNNLYGGTLGGPIIKNKLFFFVSGEVEEKSTPSTFYYPKGGSGNGTISSTSVDSLSKLANFLQTTYGYDPGAYDNWPNFKTQNHKFLGRLDWNISKTHKLTVRYSDYLSTNDVGVNALSTSFSTNSNFTSVAREGAQAISFYNSNYGFKDVVKTAAIELNSNFRGKFANNFIATITNVRDTRTTKGNEFPFVDILNGSTTSSANNYMSFGTEPFSQDNDVKNNSYIVTDNFSYFAGRHTLTAGANYEYQTLGNKFMPASQSSYTYTSLNDFITGALPRAFSLTYSMVPGEPSPYSANLKIGQLGVYAQDEINVNNHFKLTAGLRVDRPSYPSQPLENPFISSLSFPDKDGNMTHYSTGQFPKPSLYFSPRIGFRWNATEEKIVLRGGTGLFTGRMPFVYLTNMPSNSGMYQFQSSISTADVAAMNIRFNPSAAAYNPFVNPIVGNATYAKDFPTTVGTSAPTAFVLIDPNYKFPQVWRTNLGLDKQLGNGWKLSMDLLYTKDLNAVVMRNANQKATDTVVAGSDGRPRFSSTATAFRRLYSAYSSVVVLENSTKGGSFSYTVQVQKTSKNFYGSLAYTFTQAFDITANPGSTASSTWSSNPTSNTQNSQELATSSFAVPHRFVGTFSYKIEFLKHLASTFGLFYEGQTAGRYSYIYNGDLNGDGNSSDLMYVPKDASDIHFVNLAANTQTGAPAFSAQQQSDAFTAYVNQDPYLSKHKGQIVERNGAKLPFYHRVDLKFTQDIFTNFGKHKTTLQFTADCLNFLNLVNKNWGIRQQTVLSNPLKFVNYTNGVPNFTLGTYIPYGNTVPQLIDRTFVNNYSTSSTWGLQLGARLIF
jgi:outer membrane receptor protein involved in Fe transport